MSTAPPAGPPPPRPATWARPDDAPLPRPGHMPSRPPAPAGAPDPAPAALFLPGPLRVLAVTLLALLVGQRWARLTDPLVGAELLRGAGLAAVVAVLVLAIGRLPTRPGRALAAGALVIATLAAGLLAAGVPLWMLDPRDWGSLAPRLGDGIAAVPNLRVPYRGDDEWVRTTIALGGVLLLALGAALAVAGRGRPVAAAGVLVTTYTLAVTQVEQEHAFTDGLLLFALVTLLVVGDRIPLRRAPAAGAALLAVGLAGAVALPVLDARRPWVDYRALTERLGDRPAASFDWSHRYGGLPWMRDGRQVLRIAAPRPAYWKAVSLDAFDGVRWVRGRRPIAGTTPDERSRRPAWTYDVSVAVSDLRSRELYAPGEILEIKRSSARVRTDTPGTVVTVRRPIARGDSYRARVYAPQPSERELARAGADYPDSVVPALRIDLPPRRVRNGVAPPPPVPVLFAPYGSAADPLTLDQGGVVTPAGPVLEVSAYARTWALAQRLRRQSTSPHDLVRRVTAYLQDGYVYDERPPPARLPLESFLFDTRRGYCQQFSGAMALLLRMGGVPARIATGFAPGIRDIDDRDFVVRDSDAHSWVEVYVPRIGWTAVDPTPAVAPPITQLDGDVPEQDDAAAATPGGGDVPDAAGDAGGPSTPAAGADDRSAGGGGPWLVAGLTAAGLLALAALAVAAARRRPPPPGAADAALAELRRALRRSAHPVPPGATLAAVAAALPDPAAAAYVRALADARYDTPGAPRPLAADHAGRRALRRALAPAGTLARAQGYRILPPRLRG